ncbi:hypothetical protein [Dactylosporangium sp. NPDC048998]|uniref:hypothetical protein n=1 Tax=Dactylosporangium sp. NPDC048998 TaxID=3363976 RepID=UPI00371C71C4
MRNPALPGTTRSPQLKPAASGRGHEPWSGPTGITDPHAFIRRQDAIALTNLATRRLLTLIIVVTAAITGTLLTAGAATGRAQQTLPHVLVDKS